MPMDPTTHQQQPRGAAKGATARPPASLLHTSHNPPGHPPQYTMALQFTAGGGFTFEAPASSTDITFTPGGGFSLSYEPVTAASTAVPKANKAKARPKTKKVLNCCSYAPEPATKSAQW